MLGGGEGGGYQLGLIVCISQSLLVHFHRLHGFVNVSVDSVF